MRFIELLEEVEKYRTKKDEEGRVNDGAEDIMKEKGECDKAMEDGKAEVIE